jgi:hypothetical protein
MKNNEFTFFNPGRSPDRTMSLIRNIRGRALEKGGFMKKFLLFFLAIHFSLSAAEVEKATFDLDLPTLQKAATLSGFGPVYALLTNSRSGISLIEGGYFTIGTQSGVSESSVDDDCGITFGHPFAKTSYPVFAIDGNWTKPDEYFSNLATLTPFQLGDTLFVRAVAPELFSFEFAVFANEFGNEIYLRHKIVNLDAVNHRFGAGVVVDPALGKWGDGWLERDGVFQQNDTLLAANALPLIFREKSVGASGIGIKIETESEPEKMILANWPDVVFEHTPEFVPSELRTLYDLVLKFYWNATELAPGASLQNEMKISLIAPEFNGAVFLRWDLPAIFTTTNGQLFPREFALTVETASLLSSSQNGMVKLKLPGTFSTNFTTSLQVIRGFDRARAQFELNPRTLFEAHVVTLSAQFEKNGQIADQIQRNVLIPGTIKVDTGLVAFADSLVTDHFPEVNLMFGVEVAKTGQRILDLLPENISLFENGSLLTGFSVGKVQTAGSNLADVVFVLDCSGSMGDDIENVRSNLSEFADSLQAKGFDYQIGVVTFSTTVSDVWDFSADIEQIKSNLARINLWGGVEDSPAALHQASLLSWRPNSRRNIIWITDEPYPEQTYTQEQIVNQMLQLGIRVHGIGLLQLQTDWFNPIVLPTGGNFYDIYGNFRDILLDVTNLGQTAIYCLTYTSPFVEPGTNQIKLELHYGNWGMIQYYEYPVPTQNSSALLSCFPNPFNPEVCFRINRDFVSGEIQIYNVLGRLVKSFSIQKNSKPEIVWHADDNAGQPVGSGLYLVRLALIDNQRRRHQETAKILHVK